jgi:PTH1 family peptidyl-tRNA hydrolase
LGFLVVERLAERIRTPAWREACQSLVTRGNLAGHLLVLAQPQTFMNRSGAALRALLARTGVELSQVVVIHDDLDLPFGRLRIRRTGGHGGHNGVRSLIEAIGSGDFVRLKIGIGRPEENGDVTDYVLSPFTPDQAAGLTAIIDRATEALECIVVDGPVQAMNRFPI